MTRDEQLDWAKRRALDELERGSPVNAIASMASDLGKHPGLELSAGLVQFLAVGVRLDDHEDVKRFIEGFN